MKGVKKLWNSLGKNERSYLKDGIVGIIIFGLIAIVIIPLALTNKFWSIVDFSETGQIGDTINGIAGPFIALLAAFLTFLAFYIQYMANIQQRKQFLLSFKQQKRQFDEVTGRQKKEIEDREKVWEIERFENKFYELLKLHKANIDEMSIAGTIQGRKCFIHMFNELRFCYFISTNIIENTDPNDIKLFGYDDINLMTFVYRLFFFGVGIKSEKQYLSDLSEGEFNLFGRVKQKLMDVQDSFDDYTRTLQVITAPQKLAKQYSEQFQGKDHIEEMEFYYFPFDGHVGRLGHYYRHLFQTVSFVASSELLDENQKYSYIKMLRAQLSNHEQLMLYYNSLAWFNEEWRPFFTDYRLIKNLPIGLADFDANPEEFYREDIERLAKNNIKMFEKHEYY